MTKKKADCTNATPKPAMPASRPVMPTQQSHVPSLQPAAVPASIGGQMLIPGVAPDQPAAGSTGVFYEFRRSAPCPRCGGRTVRTSQHGDTQYRRCEVSICRKRFAVIGKPRAAASAESSIGWIYFIEAEGTGRVKIGWSRHVEERLGQLAAPSPVPLRLVFKMPGSQRDEAALHGQFSHLRVKDIPNSEWFYLDGDVRDFLRARVD